MSWTTYSGGSRTEMPFDLLLSYLHGKSLLSVSRDSVHWTVCRGVDPEVDGIGMKVGWRGDGSALIECTG